MTRWPRTAAPAWPVHIAFLLAVVTAGTAYAMAGPHLRTLIFAGARLDEDLVPVGDQLVHADRGDRHPVLVVLDFLGDADLHESCSFW